MMKSWACMARTSDWPFNLVLLGKWSCLLWLHPHLWWLHKLVNYPLSYTHPRMHTHTRTHRICFWKILLLKGVLKCQSRDVESWIAMFIWNWVIKLLCESSVEILIILPIYLIDKLGNKKTKLDVEGVNKLNCLKFTFRLIDFRQTYSSYLNHPLKSKNFVVKTFKTFSQ